MLISNIEETSEHEKLVVEAANDQTRTAAPRPSATESNQSLSTHQVPSQLGHLEQCHVPVDPSKDGAEEQFREMLIDGDTEEQTKNADMPPKKNLSLFSPQDGMEAMVKGDTLDRQNKGKLWHFFISTPSKINRGNGRKRSAGRKRKGTVSSNTPQSFN